MTATARQVDALTETAHLGAAQAASMLARLVGDCGVLVDVPSVAQVSSWQLAWLLGGRDVPVVAARFGIEGPFTGALWWVLPRDDAKRLGQRLVQRNGVGTISAALNEAANIVASACLSAIGTMTHAPLLPSTPEMVDGPLQSLLGPPSEAEPLKTAVLSRFLSTNAPHFSGTLLVLFDDVARDDVLRRLGVG